MFKHNRDYSALSTWAESYKHLSENMVKMTKDSKEVFSRFYRVIFYGKNFLSEQEHAKMFIYKKKFKFPIGEIATQIQRQLAVRFSLDPKKDVISLKNENADLNALEPDKLYFQIVAVQPYLEPWELEERITPFEQNFDISKFISEIPLLSASGKSVGEDDVAKQSKKKTIYKVARAFPYLTNRIEVMSLKEIILSPIECAIESMQQRVNNIRNEVYSNPVRKNNLQALLTGTLATTVHVGPLKFCEVFLTDEYDPTLQNQLRGIMAECLLLSKLGLQINASIIGPEQLPFQEMLESKYQTTSQIFQEKYAGSLKLSKVHVMINEKEKKKI